MPVAERPGARLQTLGPRHDLGHRPVLQETLRGQPAALLHQFSVHHGQHTAKALQRQPGKAQNSSRKLPGLGVAAGCITWRPARWLTGSRPVARTMPATGG